MPQSSLRVNSRYNLPSLILMVRSGGTIPLGGTQRLLLRMLGAEVSAFPLKGDAHASVTFYTCPKCHAVEPSSHAAFQYNDLDTKLKCSRCRAATPCKNWTCPCEQPWHSCSTHRCEQKAPLPSKRAADPPALPWGRRSQRPPAAAASGRCCCCRRSGLSVHP